jgi:outer membrane protein OmpA-like peptidoglycan-associated protein
MLKSAVAILALAAAGCATTFPPPSELIEARAAYGRASNGPAAQAAAARLRLAKQALDDAEMAYGGKPEQEVRDRAYVALRKIQAAEAEGAATVAGQRRQHALEELATLQGTYADQARAQIAAERGRASTAEAQASAAQQQVTAEQSRANSAEKNLETERQAREAAEAKANQALADLAREATVRREARGLVITLSGQVLFASNQATLLPAASASLDNVAAALKAMPPSGTGKVVIEGHTDSRGARAYNRDLAERRASAVRDFLVSRGVSGDLFSVQGIGPDRPVANNATAEGRANNRRVEIVLPPPPATTTAQPAARVPSLPTPPTPPTPATTPPGTPNPLPDTPTATPPARPDIPPVNPAPSPAPGLPTP